MAIEGQDSLGDFFTQVGCVLSSKWGQQAVRSDSSRFGDANRQYIKLIGSAAGKKEGDLY